MRVRLVTYLGTRGCPGVLEEALRDHFDPVAIALPVEPRLLGPRSGDDGLERDLGCVAELLAENASARAVQVAGRDEQALTGVFGQASDARERIRVHVLDPPIESSLVEHAGDLGAEVCYLSRDALDILDEGGVRLGQALEAAGIELRTR